MMTLNGLNKLLSNKSKTIFFVHKSVLFALSVCTFFVLLKAGPKSTKDRVCCLFLFVSQQTKKRNDFPYFVSHTAATSLTCVAAATKQKKLCKKKATKKGSNTIFSNIFSVSVCWRKQKAIIYCRYVHHRRCTAIFGDLLLLLFLFSSSLENWICNILLFDFLFGVIQSLIRANDDVKETNASNAALKSIFQRVKKKLFSFQCKQIWILVFWRQMMPTAISCISVECALSLSLFCTLHTQLFSVLCKHFTPNISVLHVYASMGNNRRTPSYNIVSEVSSAKTISTSSHKF